MNALPMYLAAALEAAETAEARLLAAWNDVAPRLDDFDGNNDFPRLVNNTFKDAAALRRRSQELADWLNDLNDEAAEAQATRDDGREPAESYFTRRAAEGTR